MRLIRAGLLRELGLSENTVKKLLASSLIIFAITHPRAVRRIKYTAPVATAVLYAVWKEEKTKTITFIDVSTTS